MWRHCGGNPFFVRELTRLVLARGTWSAGEVAVPEGVRATLRIGWRGCPARVSTCWSSRRRRVRRLAALLAEIGPDDTAAIAELLEEAVDARVMVATPDGCRFAHDLYRETVLAGVAPARRANCTGRSHAPSSPCAGGADPAAVGGAARLAAHFVAAGPGSAAESLHWSVEAAQEATLRLGHEDAARHYANALDLLRDTDRHGAARHVELLLGLAAAQDRSGDAHGTRDAFLRAADLARRSSDPAALAGAALGVVALGARSGTDDPVGVGLLHETDQRLATGTHGAALPGVCGAVPRATPRRGGERRPARRDRGRERSRWPEPPGPGRPRARTARRHDVVWAPGSRSPAAAAGRDGGRGRQAGDRDLVAEAVLLRAAALIEQGDPAGPAELARYIRLADSSGTHGAAGGH